MKLLFILGGYGSTGKCFSELFLSNYKDSAKLIIAGRTIKEAQEYAKYLSNKYKVEVGSAYCDPTKASTLSSIQGSSIVMVLSPNAADVTKIADACMQYKSDYYDINYSSAKVKSLKALSDKINASGQLFVSDGGFHPGMPGIFSRYALSKLPTAKSITSSLLIRQQFDHYNVRTETWDEFINELQNYDCSIYRKGKKVMVPMTSSACMKKINFGKYGTESGALMGLDELEEFAKSNPNIEETSFYVAGFNSFTNNVVIPFIYTIGKHFKKLSRKLFAWSLKKTKAPYISYVRTEAVDAKEHFVLECSHEDGYVLTAISACAFVKQYMDGVLPKKGIFVQGSVCEPKRFIDDARSLGMKTVEAKFTEI